jgi:decaprenylphospho-beta-D-erythro-pentofuranosid-2-ulose 2-reductase
MLNSFKSPQTVALIGSGSEIGQQILSHINQANLKKVILASRTGTGKYGEIGMSVKCDISTEIGRRALVQEIFSYGDIDVAIIAIGVLNGTLDEILNINFVASVDLLRQIADKMKIQSHGKILVISSFAQTRPRVDNYLYGSTKAGLDFFAQGLSEDLLGTGVSISILRPGFVHTKMTHGMAPAPFSITSSKAGEFGALAIASKTLIHYAPKKLKTVSMIIKYLPNWIFRRIAAK